MNKIQMSNNFGDLHFLPYLLLQKAVITATWLAAACSYRLACHLEYFVAIAKAVWIIQILQQAHESIVSPLLASFCNGFPNDSGSVQILILKLCDYK